MNAQILGIGTAVPPHQLSREKALEIALGILPQDERQRRLVRMMFRMSGVNNRHTVIPQPIPYELRDEERETGLRYGPSTGERLKLYAEHAPPLAAEACRAALESAGRKPKEITHLVTVSCTGFGAPGVDVSLIDNLPLRPNVQRMNIGFMGCQAAVNGVRAARAIAMSDPKAVVLLCAVELCSLHYRFLWTQEKVVGDALFADGAAALVISNESNTDVTNLWSVHDTGSCVLPDTRDIMQWSVGDIGFEMILDSSVLTAIQDHLRPWLTEWLAKHDVALDDVAAWAIHPGGPRIVDAAESALGLDKEQTALSRRVLADYGNMSSPTVLFLLEQLQGRAGNTPCVMLAFGPGMTAEAALLL